MQNTIEISRCYGRAVMEAASHRLDPVDASERTSILLEALLAIGLHGDHRNALQGACEYLSEHGLAPKPLHEGEIK